MIDKTILLALIRGLTTHEDESQYYEGTPVIKGKNYKALIDFITNS